MTCLAVNCQSIKNKVADIAAIVDQYKPDIILGNESWLYPDIESSEIFPDNYNIYRKDRISDNHGGVFQAVKKDIIVTHRDDLNTDCEIIWTQCQIQNKRSKSLFFASFYRPNKTDISSLHELDSSLFKLGDRLNTSNVIVAGDFNALDLKSLTLVTVQKRLLRRLVNLILSSNVTPSNVIGNLTRNLDLTEAVLNTIYFYKKKQTFFTTS